MVYEREILLRAQWISYLICSALRIFFEDSFILKKYIFE